MIVLASEARERDIRIQNYVAERQTASCFCCRFAPALPSPAGNLVGVSGVEIRLGE